MCIVVVWCLHVCLHMRDSTRRCACMHTHLRTYVHTYVRACMHTKGGVQALGAVAAWGGGLYCILYHTILYMLCTVYCVLHPVHYTSYHVLCRWTPPRRSSRLSWSRSAAISRGTRCGAHRDVISYIIYVFFYILRMLHALLSTVICVCARVNV